MDTFRLAARRSLLALVVLAVVALGPWLGLSPAGAGSALAPCPVPGDLLRLDAPLKRTAARLRDGGRLTIVAIGSSSTFGAGASDPAFAYPSRLHRILAKRFPGTEVRVINRGVNGETVDQMLHRFEGDVIDEAPDLVVWQVGANTVLRWAQLGRYRAILDEGIASLRAAGADVILMDPQFAPKVLARPLHQAVVDETDRAARASGVGIFRRYAIMRHWVEGGDLGFPVLLDPDQLHLNDRGYGCVAAALAEAILRAALAPPEE